MNTLAGGLLVVTALFALLDWYAVHRSQRGLEYLAKPATMVALIGVAVTLDVTDLAVRDWFLAALVLSLLGDVFLMLPQDRFVAGLASFLLGHIAYIVGLWSADISVAGLLVGVAVVAALLPILGSRIVKAVRSSTEPELLGPVAVYILVITAMVVSAGASGRPIAFAGALSFYASDALIAWTRFVQDYAWGRLAVIVTYHAAQVALVLSLV